MIEQVRAIGFVEAVRPHAEDDFWGGEDACISLIEQFSPPGSSHSGARTGRIASEALSARWFESRAPGYLSLNWTRSMERR